MTSDNASGEESALFDPKRNQPGVLCNRCDWLNYLGREQCERCGAPLFVECDHCGERNPCVFTRCKSCRHRLRQRGRGGRSSRAGKHRAAPGLRLASAQLIWALVVFLLLVVLALLFMDRLKG